MEKKFLITAEYGIHARPATRLVNKALSYLSDINLRAMDKEVNLKSIMGVMSLGIYKDEEVSIVAEGPDANEALQGLAEFLSLEGIGYEIK